MEFKCICTFMDQLPLTEAFCMLCEHVDSGFSMMPLIFPAFENLAVEVLTIDTQHCRLTALHSSSSMIPHCSAAPSSTATTAPALTDTSSAWGNRPFCTNCKTLGHVVDNCWKSRGGDAGGHDRYLTSHPHLLNHLRANLATDATLVPDPDPSPNLPLSDTIVAPQVPVTTDVVESTLLDFYSESLPEFVGFADVLSDLPPYLDFLHLLEPVVLASFTSHFNAIPDSGCTTHIICDRSWFWTYDVGLAMPVGTANCGTLMTLAWGEVHFRIVLDGIEHTVCLHDCLHAPDVPINLLSVGAMQEKQLMLVFGPGEITTIHLPRSMAGRAGLTIKVTFLHHLSFLQCDFLLPPSAPDLPVVSAAYPALSLSDYTPNVFFPHIPADLDLWHRCVGHLGMEAMKALLTKPYATGITYDGDLTLHHCILCLIDKHSQQPFSHHRHRATKTCELIHMDACGPFPVETPFRT